MKRIVLVLEFEGKTMQAIDRIAKEDGLNVDEVLHNALLKGLARRTVDGPVHKQSPMLVAVRKRSEK